MEIVESVNYSSQNGISIMDAVVVLVDARASLLIEFFVCLVAHILGEFLFVWRAVPVPREVAAVQVNEKNVPATAGKVSKVVMDMREKRLVVIVIFDEIVQIDFFVAGCEYKGDEASSE